MAGEDTKVLRDTNGDRIVVKSGGSIVMESGSTLEMQSGAAQTIGDKKVPDRLELAFKIAPNATVTEYDIWVATGAYKVIGIKYVPSTLQGAAMTATVVKSTGTATPVKTTTPMVTADVIDLNAGAYTVVSPALSATAADLVLAAGDRIGIDYSAAPTAAHWALSITLERL